MEQKKTEPIGELLQQLRELTSIPDDDDIIRNALEFHLAHLRDQQSLLERIQPILRRAEVLGELDENFDLKKFCDDMWDEK